MMMDHNKKVDVLTLLGRVFIAPLFLIAGYGKVVGFAGTVAYTASVGVPFPEVAVVVAIIVELLGGLMLLVGFQTRWTALALAVFTVITAFYFHTNFGDQTQMVMFLKNFAIAGGLLFVKAMGAGAYSVDAKMMKPKMDSM